MFPEHLDWRDFYRALGYKVNDSQKHPLTLIQMSKENLPNYAVLEEAIFSDRSAQTISQLAAKIGMMIPPDKTYGLHAYHYFLDNFRLYQGVSIKSKSPTPESLPDDKLPITPTKWTDRHDLLNKVKQEEVNKGVFSMITTNFSLTQKTNASMIKYNDNQRINLYTLVKLRNLVDHTQKVLWKSIGKEKFSTESVLGLRQVLVEQLSKWTNAKIHISKSNQFVKLLLDLDAILVGHNLVPYSNYVDPSYIDI